jgi:hypothetical protein
MPQPEKESRKNAKRKERTSQSSIDGLWNKNGKPVSQIASYNNQRQLHTVMNNYNNANNALGQSQAVGQNQNGQTGGSLNKLPIYNSSQNYSMQQQ